MCQLGLFLEINFVQNLSQIGRIQWKHDKSKFSIQQYNLRYSTNNDFEMYFDMMEILPLKSLSISIL